MVSGEYPADLGLPSDSNLSVFKLQFKVDGKKVEPLTEYKTTYWSNGDTVPVLMPPPGGKKVTAEVIYTIRNLFVIPPAPTEFAIECKKLTVGFAPIPGFQFSGFFTAAPAKI